MACREIPDLPAREIEHLEYALLLDVEDEVKQLFPHSDVKIDRMERGGDVYRELVVEWAYTNLSIQISAEVLKDLKTGLMDAYWSYTIRLGKRICKAAMDNDSQVEFLDEVAQDLTDLADEDENVAMALAFAEQDAWEEENELPWDNDGNSTMSYFSDTQDQDEDWGAYPGSGWRDWASAEDYNDYQDFPGYGGSL